jgi:flagellar assembly protein FliH
VPLVKNEHAVDLLRTAVVLNLGDIREQADAILREARDAAQRIITDAHEEAARLTHGAEERGHTNGSARGLAQGHAEGLQVGQKEGEIAAREQLSSRLEVIDESWAASLKEWNLQRTQQLEEGRRDLLRFSLAIARRIVGRLPELDPSCVEQQVSEAIDLLFDRTQLTIRVHPRDSSLVKSSLPKILGELGAGSDARIKADPTVGRGGCVVCAPDGEIDARLETQLSRIIDGLLPEVSGSDPLERPL